MKNLALFLITSIMLTACTKRSGEEIESTEIPSIEAICIIHDSPIREKPLNESDFITSLFLGDEIRFLGERKSDLSNEFYKVELFDGTKGWLQKDAILFNARHAAVIVEATLYRQSETIDENLATLYPGEYVAIIKQDGEWVKVIGANRKKNGWIKRESLSTEGEDIFISTLAHSDLLDDEGKIIRKQLPYFIHSLPDKNAPLAIHLKNILEQEVADAIAVSILEYEMEYFEEEEN